MKPRLLDLFCGAGGAAMGYHRAGFDVTGVDIKPQPRYPFTFHQGDATTWPLNGYDAIHASPPCQDHSISRNATPGLDHGTRWMLDATLDRLRASGLPWVVENVPGAPMPGALILCGSEFGLVAPDANGRLLALRRHRNFLSNVPLWGAGGCSCAVDRAAGRIAGVYGNGSNSPERARLRHGGYTPPGVGVRRQLMGIDWMNRDELSQAIPPAYTEHIGWQLLAHLQAAA